VVVSVHTERPRDFRIGVRGRLYSPPPSTCSFFTFEPVCRSISAMYSANSFLRIPEDFMSLIGIECAWRVTSSIKMRLKIELSLHSENCPQMSEYIRSPFSLAFESDGAKGFHVFLPRRQGIQLQE